SFPLARLAASAGNVEGKSSRLVAALPRFRQHGIQVANVSEYSGVRGRIRSWRSSDRRLVDLDYLVDALHATDGFVLARVLSRVIQVARQRAIQDVVHQCGLPRAADARNHR